MSPQSSTQTQHGQASSRWENQPAQGARGAGAAQTLRAPVSAARPRTPERGPQNHPHRPAEGPGPSSGGRAGRGAARSGPARTQRGGSGGAAGSGRAPARGGASGRARAHPPSVCRWRAPRPRRRSWPSRSSALTWSRLHRARTRPCPSPAEKAPPPLPQPGRATAGRRLATAEAPAPPPAPPIRAQRRR